MADSPPQWITDDIVQLTQQFGQVPPPWVIYPDTHPYSICWRMGGGESHIMVWSHWWDSQRQDEDQRLAYFQKWPPPPCWLAWTADALWNLEPSDWEPDEEEDNYAPYFAKLESAGLGNWAEYERDLNDPKYLESEEI